MPISFSCPNCGKQFTVADQFAGQTGPCAGCSKPLTVPLSSMPSGPGYAANPKPSSGGGASAAVIVATVVVLLLLCTGIPMALLWPAMTSAKQAAKKMQSSNNLKMIGLALHNYHDTFKALPPAVVTDANGKPLYSGRVLLLPFLEQRHLFDAFDPKQAWDSPANIGISQSMVPVFQDPARGANRPGETDYLFVTGAGTLFEQGVGIDFSNVKDGLSNTIAVVEVKGSGIHWAEPRDIDLSQATQLPAGHYSQGNQVLFADGSVRTLTTTIAPETLKAISTRSGGEVAEVP